MATNMELQQINRSMLFELLKLKKVNDGNDVKGLDELILKQQTVMQEEDVAWVEKNISKL